MNPFVLFGILFTLGLSTTVVFASSHWILAWMGLEVSTLAILPIMAQHHHPRAIEAATKYFLVQASATAMLLFASSTNAWLTGQWNIQQMSHPLPLTLIMLALALKIGLAPLHSWLPEVVQGLDLTTGAILASWQKLAPFALILQIQPPNPILLTLLGLASTLVGGWGGLNQTQLRKVLAYSSIGHLGWMILVLQFCPSLTLLALLTYFALTLATFLMLKLNDSTNINMLAAAWAKAPLLTALAPLTLLSLGGLPPLTGFMPKWLILQELSNQHLAATAVMAALSALLSLYFYSRLAFAMTLTHTPNNPGGQAPWRLQPLPFTLLLATSTTLGLMVLPLTPALLALVNF